MFRISSAVRQRCFRTLTDGKIRNDSSALERTVLKSPHPIPGSALCCISTREYYSVDQAKRDLNAAMQEAQNIGKGPLPVLVVGGASMLPFVTVPFMCLMGGSCDASWAFSQVAYSASILSFLGGIRYAVTLGLRGGSTPDTIDYRVLAPAIGPVVASWLSLLFPTPLALLTVAGSLVGMAYVDVLHSPYPDWYKGLRFVLTSVAVVSLMLTLFFHLVLGDRKRDYRSRKVSKEDH
ncbi:transmembrane protein 69-like [Paramacrobiotus metropolitanus]|uniref:transmembrane protein 69-like n=1 Tax=Paramacrobiotus metropolitanus TaxID=2943436 RepID=UPI00244650D9|nr:transmembrane protein 69-like [Paramacrobiotus metropolitanus]